MIDNVGFDTEIPRQHVGDEDELSHAMRDQRAAGRRSSMVGTRVRVFNLEQCVSTTFPTLDHQRGVTSATCLRR